MCGCADLQAYK